MSQRILITPRSLTKDGHPSFQALTDAGYELVYSTPGKQPSEEELLRLLPGCVGFLAGVEPITARVLESASQLRVISRNGTGIDNIDLAAAERLGIKICRAEGANAQGVAELTIGLLFALARSIPFSDQGIKAGGWERRLGMELEGKTLGLVGCGRIGRIVARLALGLGMRVIAFDVFRDPQFAVAQAFRYGTLDEVLAQADVISLHCPAQPNGQPLLDAAALSRMRRGVLVINTARASLIDNEALRVALESGQVAGAALDVFEPEPPVGSAIVVSDRVVATPHSGSYTRESVDRLVRVAVDNLLEHLRREKEETYA
jgi:phosphoglycerate dehydrogenase-like enzyme